MIQVSRRYSLAFGLMCLSAPSLAADAPADVGVATGTKLYEHTFLKAKPGLRADLGRYIRANWFPLDRKGVEEGIFTSYWLLEDTGENAAWDYVMVVGYPTELGFGEPRATEVFQAIRKGHAEVKVAGRGLRELGDIVASHRLKVTRS
ncbi:hypothetical protein [Phenylobacterium sp.]|jgi:hypothetical protein|uniref:hypothetical protein n=1 Tax=Phenylobacterium sp. TaxID=1871053 RepID=UPI0037C86AE9